VHIPVTAAEGQQPGRREVGVQQVGKQHFKCHRLAGAVVAAQQETATVEREDLLVVEIEVEDSRTQRLPAAPLGLRDAEKDIDWQSGGHRHGLRS